MQKRILHTILVVLVAIAASAQTSVSIYESWIDNDYDHRTVAEVTGDSVSQVIDLNGWEEGIYFYNFRAQNTDGEWGPLYRYLIFVAEPDASAQVAAIHYWLDSDTLNVMEQAARGTTVNISVDVSQLEKGTHTFSCYLQNILGDTTEVFHYDFELGYVERPVLARREKSVTMQTTTPGATIYYTLDGSKPTKDGLRYTEPIVPTANGRIRAIAVREGWFNSEEATLTVNWIAEPSDKEPVNINLAELEKESGQSGTKINDIKQQYNERIAYQEGQHLLCDTLRALLECCRFDVAEKTRAYLNEVEKIEEQLPGVETLQHQINSEYAALQATLDSLNVLEDSLSSKLDAAITKEEVAQINQRVVALQQGYALVNTQLQQLTDRINEWTGQVAALTAQMKFIENDIVENTVGIVAKFVLRADHLTGLKRFPLLRYVDLSQCTMEDDVLPDRAFSGLPLLLWASLPANLVSVGSSLYADCPNIAAVMWNGTNIVSDRALADIDNPNLLLYVNSSSQVRDISLTNVVVNGIASNIILTDGDGQQNVNFYVPKAFHVSGDISYTHSYDQTTVIGQCRGWETICLPFDVDLIEHETNGEAVPFAAYEYPKRPFWFCHLTEQGFEDADSIRAGRPYIISMPNSEVYAPYYRLAGKVTFSSRNIDVPVTEYVVDYRGESSFVPTFERVAASSQVFTLNVGDERDGYAEGSVFISNYADVRPFQCYRQTNVAGVRYIGIVEDFNTDIQDIPVIGRVQEDGRYYNLQGLQVKNPEKGIYILNGKKIIKY